VPIGLNRNIQNCLPLGAPILPNLLRYQAVAVKCYSFALDALYLRQTRRLQNSGLYRLFVGQDRESCNRHLKMNENGPNSPGPRSFPPGLLMDFLREHQFVIKPGWRNLLLARLIYQDIGTRPTIIQSLIERQSGKPWFLTSKTLRIGPWWKHILWYLKERCKGLITQNSEYRYQDWSSQRPRPTGRDLRNVPIHPPQPAVHSKLLRRTGSLVRRTDKPTGILQI